MPYEVGLFRYLAASNMGKTLSEFMRMPLIDKICFCCLEERKYYEQDIIRFYAKKNKQEVIFGQV